MAIRRTTISLGAAIILATALAPALAHQPPEHKLPKPGGSPKALAPIPAPGKYFGFNDHSFLNQRRLVSPEQVAALARPAGANVLRFEIAWEDVEPSRDVWDEDAWNTYEAIDRAFLRQGIRPLVVLGRTPSWARDQGAAAACSGEAGCEYPPAFEELDHWGEFAAEVASRFHDPIIETWNEPNLSLFFKPQPDPGRYAAMHVAAYNNVKRVRPSVPVLLGGNANAPANEYSSDGRIVTYSQRQFLTRIYPKVEGKLDGIGVHPYAAAPRLLGAQSLVSHALHDVRAVEARFNDRGNDLWITETGFSTTGPGAVSELGQARGLLGVYRMLTTMADVRGVVIHTLFDQTDVPPILRAYGFGIIADDDPLDYKLAYCEFNGRARRALAAGCVRRGDGKAPGARQARRLQGLCRQWLEPQPSYRGAGAEARQRLRDECLLQLLTIDTAQKGRIEKIRRAAARQAAGSGQALASSRGRRGLALVRRAVAGLARSGYL